MRLTPCGDTFSSSIFQFKVVSLWQAMDKLMPGFDGEIAKMAQRVLVNPRHIDWHTGVLATKVTPGTYYTHYISQCHSLCKDDLTLLSCISSSADSCVGSSLGC